MDHLIVLTRGPLKTTAGVSKLLCFPEISPIGSVSMSPFY